MRLLMAVREAHALIFTQQSLASRANCCFQSELYRRGWSKPLSANSDAMTESEAAPRPMQLVQEDEGEGPPPMDPAGPGGSGREGEGDSGDGESLESSLSQTSLLTYSGNEVGLPRLA